MNTSKKKGDQQFTMDGGKAEITVDLALQANGPEDTVEVFSGTLRGPDGSSKFMDDCEIGVLSKTKRATKERDQKLQGHCAHIGDVKVVCILC